MYILGLGQIGGEDSSVVLIKDGQIRVAIEEERIKRQKHVGGFPEKAIEKALENEGICLADVEHIAIVDRPFFRFIRRNLDWYLPKIFSYPKNALYHIFHDEIPTLFDFVKAKEKLLSISQNRAKIHFVEHHLAHMASTFLVSSFDEAAILTFDARGEVATTAIGWGHGEKVKKLKEARMPHSLGMFYAGITDYLGFRHGEDEYKVMGLASYAKPVYLEQFRDIIRFDKKRLLISNLDYFTYQNGRGFFSQAFRDLFGPPRKPSEPVEERHKNIASSAQCLLEEIIIKLGTYTKEMTGAKNLCMAGGVALNCVANGRLYQKNLFEKIFVQPAAGDNGGALGAAYYVYNMLLKNKRNYVMESANIGPEFSNCEIERALKTSKVDYRRSADICREAAQAIAAGKIVGWFQGKMEFGPRALGSRSILADPTVPHMKDLINHYVKFREEFRPFAPSVKAEAANNYFHMDFVSPFMLFVVPVREEAKGLLPAITHVDGTARVQCVEKTVEPKYWRLIDEFEKIKGIPVILNTSFNVMGEPIVFGPEDAIRCFFYSGIDLLVIGDYIIEKMNI